MTQSEKVPLPVTLANDLPGCPSMPRIRPTMPLRSGRTEEIDGAGPLLLPVADPARRARPAALHQFATAPTAPQASQASSRDRDF